MAAGFFPSTRQVRDTGHAGSAFRTTPSSQRPASEHASYLPPGWPPEVLPPGTPDWEVSAGAFLLDCCPADYRAHAVLRRHPVVLARLAAEFVESQIRASRTALARSRSGLGDYVGPDVLDSTVEVLQTEEARLVRTHRAVLLVEGALRGASFLPRL